MDPFADSAVFFHSGPQRQHTLIPNAYSNLNEVALAWVAAEVDGAELDEAKARGRGSAVAADRLGVNRGDGGGSAVRVVRGDFRRENEEDGVAAS